jgi:hypothetical protein
VWDGLMVMVESWAGACVSAAGEDSSPGGSPGITGPHGSCGPSLEPATAHTAKLEAKS